MMAIRLCSKYKRMRFIFTMLATIISASVYCQWSSDPSTNNAVCNFSGSQTLVQLVSDGAGGAISTWVDTRNGAQDIYAQRTDMNGVLLWAVDGIAICNAASDQFSPRLVSDGSGGAIITWYDNRSGDYDIYAQRINASGVVQWTADGVAICVITGNQNAQQLMADGVGGAIIVWSDGRSGGPNADIYAQRINAAGTVQWTANGAPVCTASSLQNIPQLVSDGAGGAIITWEDWRNFSQSDIYAQRIASNGFTSWSFNGVVICSESNLAQQYNTKIVTDGSGGAIISWLDNRNFSSNTDIYAQKVNTSGVTQWISNGIPICTADLLQISQQMIADGSGGAIISWEDRRTERDIYAQRVNTSGSIQWPANGMVVCDVTGIQTEPQLLARASGGALFVWTDSRNGSPDIFAQGIDAAGAALWITNGVPVANESHSQTAAQLITDGADGAFIAWQDLRTTVDYDIYSSRLFANGSLPLRLLSFSASNNGKDVLLSWNTDNEMNSFYFDIEFSGNGSSFTKLGAVSARNLSGNNQYHFTHLSPVNNVLFYRLKLVDVDGKFVYSKIISVTRSKTLQVVLYPNPASNSIRVTNCNAEEVQEIQVLNSNGSLVMTGKANNQLQFNISHLSAGVYVLKVLKKDKSCLISQFEKY